MQMDLFVTCLKQFPIKGEGIYGKGPRVRPLFVCA